MKATSNVQGFGPQGVGTEKKIKLAMEDLWLGGTLTPHGGRLVVRHIFQSAETEPLEVVYCFALPKDAALRQFVISGDDFEVKSELRPVEEARKVYEEAISDGHTASMAQVYRDGIVNLTVGNIRPGEIIRVHLELVAGVELKNDGFRFRFPFTMSPCYHADARTGTDDGKGIIELPEDKFGDVMLPPWKLDGKGLHTVGFGLDIQHPAGAATISSVSHPIAVTAQTSKTVVASALDSETPDRDLVLDVKIDVNRPALYTGIDGEGVGRIAAVLPSNAFGKVTNNPRKLVFLVDRSGSMGGKPIEQAKQSLKACVSALDGYDLFSIIIFGSDIEHLYKKMSIADEKMRGSAFRFIESIDVSGGTELEPALMAAAKLLGGEGDILLMTDGEVYGGDEIIARLAKLQVRIHVLGIGSASQDRFLSQMARQSDGVCRYMTPRERVDIAALELFNAIGNPTATAVTGTVSPNGKIMPTPPALVYDNAPWTCFASIPGAKDGEFKLTWISDNKQQNLSLPVNFAIGNDGETIKLLQGARLISDMEASMHGNYGSRTQKRDNDRQKELLKKLSMEYGLASQAVSLVAVVIRPGDSIGQIPITKVVPLGLPQDMDEDAYFKQKDNNVFYSLASSNISCCMIQPKHRLAESGTKLKEEMLIFENCEDDNFFKVPDCILSNEISSSTPEDYMVEIAGKILPDGGMPGTTPQDRLEKSIIAMLAFAAWANTGSTAFNMHQNRLLKFLENQNISGLDKMISNLVTNACAATITSNVKHEAIEMAIAVIINGDKADIKKISGLI